MKNSDLKLVKNIKLISIYIFNKESPMKAINNIYSAVEKYNLNTELIKITSISFSLAVTESKDTDLFIESLKNYSDVKIKKNLSVLHIENDAFSDTLLSEMFSVLSEEELRMIHYRFNSNRVTLISEEKRLDTICSKIKC